jgi:hypothetical protein
VGGRAGRYAGLTPKNSSIRAWVQRTVTLGPLGQCFKEEGAIHCVHDHLGAKDALC